MSKRNASVSKCQKKSLVMLRLCSKGNIYLHLRSWNNLLLNFPFQGSSLSAGARETAAISQPYHAIAPIQCSHPGHWLYWLWFSCCWVIRFSYIGDWCDKTQLDIFLRRGIFILFSFSKLTLHSLILTPTLTGTKTCLSRWSGQDHLSWAGGQLTLLHPHCASPFSLVGNSELSFGQFFPSL